jgi:hypothetical protein
VQLLSLLLPVLAARQLQWSRRSRMCRWQRVQLTATIGLPTAGVILRCALIAGTLCCVLCCGSGWFVHTRLQKGERVDSSRACLVQRLLAHRFGL